MWYVLTAVLLSGCFAQKPVISDIRHDVVRVQINPNIFLKRPTEAEILAEARTACGIYGRIPSNILSHRNFAVGPYEARTEYLIACGPGVTPKATQAGVLSEEDLFSDLDP